MTPLAWVLLAWLAQALLARALRRRAAILQRLNDVNWSVVVLADIVAGFAIFNLLWLFAALGERPRSGETISAFAGRHAALGLGWAEKLAACIDALFFVLVGQRGHCATEARRG